MSFGRRPPEGSRWPVSRVLGGGADDGLAGWDLELHDQSQLEEPQEILVTVRTPRRAAARYPRFCLLAAPLETPA